MQFNLITTLDDAPHQFRCYAPADDEWLEELAAEYVALRTTCSFDLEDVRLDGIEILSASALQARLEANTVPTSTGGGNFDVVRSDMGELLHYLLLEAEFQTRFGYKSIRDRELIQPERHSVCDRCGGTIPFVSPSPQWERPRKKGFARWLKGRRPRP